MKVLITVIAFVFTCLAHNVYAQEDTLGFWQVSYNGKEIRPVTLKGESTYLMDSIADSAKINVYYYTESACKKCLCKLQVRNENSIELKTIQRKGYGDNVPFTFSGAEVKKMMGKNKIYLYFSGKYDGWMPWIFLGSLKYR